ncbi:Nucleolar protein 16 [Yamadazyma tenuis]|uniref:Nucleolar protein 16 n=1 Tax=Candida tenuis (strain ATCC 10573 / BCRC 21748 / CBS 615 / JCM 9827 / NBRC 10315 / NRRL Y-1498 / VKM Y-70) TaxID=590646 RepID=G3BEW9_CANTC|nr:uncharacterized protein CANTEDRAFT_115981 [Yamadazyma tenuis ATCC 10573]EGV59956.1 hypothetical protein CANTEDRAFT_115981 [Yamadazyma tenuis ATCC 10573]WEJ94820.1 Nucleolar protein 16 [Yamadazyma tenuis]
MASVRKRKMARSSVKKNTRRLKDKHARVKIFSNPLIKEKWDSSLTLQQNYKKLGLRAKLGHIAGGVDRPLQKYSDGPKDDPATVKPEDVEQTEDPAQIPEGEARIIRDPDTNEVIKVIYGTMKGNSTQNQKEDSEVVQELQKTALKNASIVKERVQSERESDWLTSLYEKYGDDYEKMKWDKKLNIYQQSAGDLKRRIIKWKKANK